MEAAVPKNFPLGVPPSNDLDLKRIERALRARKRYRYVLPKVLAWLADIGSKAVLLSEHRRRWRNYRCRFDPIRPGAERMAALSKGSSERDMEFHSTCLRLPEVLERLNTDPERKFWQ